MFLFVVIENQGYSTKWRVYVQKQINFQKSCFYVIMFSLCFIVLIFFVIFT